MVGSKKAVLSLTGRLKAKLLKLKKSTSRATGRAELTSFLESEFQCTGGTTTASASSRGKDQTESEPVAPAAQCDKDAVDCENEDVDVETEADQLRDRVTSSYSKVRNLTKKLRRREAQLSRQEDELSVMKKDEAGLREACQDYEAKLNEA